MDATYLTCDTASLTQSSINHDVRDQHAGNDIPLLFGLLCICYGARAAMIKILQHIVLFKSYPTLYVLQSKLIILYFDFKRHSISYLIRPT